MGGPILIGENNLIEEQATIHNEAVEGGSVPVMIIGNNNVFEVRITVDLFVSAVLIED